MDGRGFEYALDLGIPTEGEWVNRSARQVDDCCDRGSRMMRGWKECGEMMKKKKKKKEEEDEVG